MIHNIKRYLRLYRSLISQFMKFIMQSKLDFSMGLFGFFFTQIMGIVFLYLVFEQIPNLNGWTLDQLIFIYGFAQIPRGIDHLMTDNIWLVAWQHVRNGNFDRYMLRPMNLFFQVIAEKLQPDALGELLVGTILVIRSVQIGVIEMTPLKWVMFVISILAGAVIYTAIKLFFASFAFWMKVSGPVLYTAYELANFAKYPVSIYNRAIQLIITWVIPFAFVAFYPASYFLGVGNIWMVWIECGIAVVFFMIAYALFQKGTTVYESAGN